MSAKTFWDDRFTMLMACASPGSAFAYHLGLTRFGPDVLRRDMATPETAATAEADPVKKADDALTELVASGRVLVLP
jgi:hypothetical protein